ncbi:hypothetical protein DPMN_077372 [Dreissena polymorpha]|uniref:Uncharacterized protein n=1 Tax=Dreissena polymorpha TaxID=45954 RepID=A0A9D3YKU0_DREPO|nr:hypothetical protein DPMN_077372 [Dreissena polymorpha]
MTRLVLQNNLTAIFASLVRFAFMYSSSVLLRCCGSSEESMGTNTVYMVFKDVRSIPESLGMNFSS